MGATIDDLTLGGYMYKNARDIRRLVDKNRNAFKGIKEVAVKGTHNSPRFLFTQDEALVAAGLLKNTQARDAATRKINEFFLLEVGTEVMTSHVPTEASPSVAADTFSSKYARNGETLNDAVDRVVAQVPQVKKVRREYDLIAVAWIGSVNFRGLFAIPLIQGKNEHRYVPLKEQAEAIGLDPSAFRRRVLRNHPQSVAMMATPGGQNALMIDIQYLPGILMGIDTGRVRQEIQPHVHLLKEEYCKVLADYEYKGNASNPGFTQEERDETRAEQDAAIGFQELTQAIKVLSDNNQQTTGLLERTLNTLDKMWVVFTKIELALLGKPTAPALPQTIDPPNTVSVNKIDVQDKDTNSKLAEYFDIQAEHLREIICAMGLVGDPHFGQWYDVATGFHGNNKQNWAIKTDEVIPLLRPVVEFYRGKFNEAKAQGIKNFAATALQATLEYLRTQKPAGIGAYKKLTRKKPRGSLRN